MAPVLAYADFSLPYILEVNVCQGGPGAILSQEQEGMVRPVVAVFGLLTAIWPIIVS